ncbi:MAG: cytochrome c-type biogenesis protein CcmH [Pseudomonadales bacterium]|nr:cytochrome c-type biogenesis protein CcmH [Pseudomonadales bacterium]
MATMKTTGAFLLALMLWTLPAVAPDAIHAGAAYAAVDTFEFETDEQQHRFRRMSDEFRCPMCQNTSLTGSNGGVAEDLRREIYLMIMDGKTDEEIEQFMFERYGDFVFYRPRLMWQTVLLWFGPLLFLLFGGWLIVGIVRRAQVNKVEEQVVLNEDEQAQLRKLLDTVKDRD